MGKGDVAGNIISPIKLGTIKNINKHLLSKQIINYIAIGFIISFLIYHIALWITRRRDIENLIFAVCCLLILLRSIIMYVLLSSLINFEASVLVFEIENKIIYMSVILAQIFFPLFYYTVFKFKYSKISIKLIVIISSILGLSVLILPTKIFSAFLILYQAVLVIICIWIIVYNVFAVVKKKEGAFLLLVGMIIFVFIVMNDIIYSHNKSFSIYLFDIGFSIFILFNSLFISLKIARKLNHEEYLTSNLTHEVQKKTAALNLVLEQKTKIFVNIAHETKTPLTLIKNYLDKYIETHGEDKSLQVIKINIKKLERDMVNFLDMEKIERGGLFYNHDQVTSISEIVRMKNILFKETAIQKKIELDWEVEENLLIKIDPDALDRILNNLLDNAIKFTGENGKIIVILHKVGAGIELIVSDSGIGIPKEAREYILLPYYQISHKKRNVQGLGMGLYLTKEIIESINASLSINNKQAGGTEFIITFKEYKTQAGDQIVTDFTLSVPSKIIQISQEDLAINKHDTIKDTILIVEDDLQLIMSIKERLENDYNVYCALNGADALSLLEKIHKPDIIVSDIMMDEMDGYVFRDRLMMMNRFKSIPFIFLTAKHGIEEHLKGLSKKAVDYISKPFNMNVLTEKIASWLALLQAHYSTKKISAEHVKRFEEFAKKYYLTNREKEILVWLIRGYENKDIAQKLYISPNTAKTHIYHIKEKVGMIDKIDFLDYLHKYIGD